MRIRTGDEARAAAHRFRERARCDSVLVTRGEHGMWLLGDRTAKFDLPAEAREVSDVTGAGDTVIAAMALGLAAGGVAAATPPASPTAPPASPSPASGRWRSRLMSFGGCAQTPAPGYTGPTGLTQRSRRHEPQVLLPALRAFVPSRRFVICRRRRSVSRMSQVCQLPRATPLTCLARV